MALLRAEALTLINFVVRCVECDKEYVPATRKEDLKHNLACVIHINNWCSRNCFEATKLKESEAE